MIQITVISLKYKVDVDSLNQVKLIYTLIISYIISMCEEYTKKHQLSANRLLTWVAGIKQEVGISHHHASRQATQPHPWLLFEVEGKRHAVLENFL